MIILWFFNFSASFDCKPRFDVESGCNGAGKWEVWWIVFPSCNKMTAMPVQAVELILIFVAFKKYTELNK